MLGDFSSSELLELVENEHLAPLGEHRLENTLDHCQRLLAFEKVCRVGVRRRRFFVERRALGRSTDAAPPKVAGNVDASRADVRFQLGSVGDLVELAIGG